MMLTMLFQVVVISYSAQSQPDDRWQSGSSQSLRGEVLTLYCFVETKANPWTPDEKRVMLQALQQAQEWLMGQAGNWQVGLQFETKDLHGGEVWEVDDIPTGIGSGAEPVDWIRQATHQAGYRNAKVAYQKLSKQHGQSNMHVLIFAKADGISYAIRYAHGMHKKKYQLEGVLVYQRYDNGAEMPVPAIIAHEILHTCGAWDLYATYAQTREKQAKAMELYPDDIMLRVGHDLNSLKADKLTAWLVGWNPVEESQFEWFRPEDFKK